MSAPDDSRPPAPELTRGQKALTLVGVLLGMLLAALDQTIVATAGPVIQRDLAMPAALYAWITTAYMVSSTVLVPLWGKLSDLLGRKPVLLAGIGVFLLGSLLCGLSRGSTALIVARAVQGLGAASLFTSAFAVVADIFPPAVRGRYTGLFGGVWALSSVVGPLVGGLLTDQLGWHWAFFVNLPVGAIAVLVIAAWMPPLGRRTGRAPVDVAGALALIAAIVPLLLALSLGRSAGAMLPAGVGADLAAGAGFAWSSWPILALLGTAVAGLVAFVLIERRAADPILDLALFNNPIFAWGNAAAFAIGASFFAGIVFLPLFTVNVLGLSATDSGMTMMPLTLGIVAGNVAAGQLVSRLGRYRGLMLGALALLAGALALMAFTLGPGATRAELIFKMVLIGLGVGPSIPLYTIAVQNGVPPARIGVATASVTFFRQMGATVGVAALGTIFANVMTGAMAGARSLPDAISAGTRAVFWGALAITVVAAALTTRIPDVPLRKTQA